MKKDQEEKRVRLRTKAEKVIEAYLEWEVVNPEPDLRQIEEIVVKLRKALGQEMAQIALEERAGQKPVPGPICPKCGQEMRYKGEKAVQIASRVGGLKIERGHYYCPKCQESIFPPGSAVETK